MTPRERLLAAVRGEPVDRIPFTAWHHFHLTPRAGVGSGLAEAEQKFYETFQPDLLKAMHDIDYEPMPEIDSPDDWRALTVLKPHCGNFGRQLDSLHVLRWELQPTVPVIATVFGVYHYANELSKGKLLEHLRAAPHAVNMGLAIIAESLRRYVRATLEIGCEGIYYAISGASSESASHDEYAAPFKEYDRVVLEAAAGAPFNVIHLHGYKDLYFDVVKDLPASIVCWSDRAGNGPTLAEAKMLYNGCLMGGIDETRFAEMTPQEIVSQGREAIEDAGRLGFILSPGCSVPNNAPVEKLRAIAQAAGRSD